MDRTPADKANVNELASSQPPETQAAHSADDTSSSNEPPWCDLSPQQKYAYPWTIEELLKAVKEDHSWLHPDPRTAERWKIAIMRSVYPTVSLTLFGLTLFKDVTFDRLEAGLPESSQVTAQLRTPHDEDRDEYVFVRGKNKIQPDQSCHCDEDDYVLV